MTPLKLLTQDFLSWDEEHLQKFMQKIIEFSKEPLHYWKNQRIGSGKNNVLELYNTFPLNSDFHHPKHVPIDVSWARFRLDSKTRLVGFVVPISFCSQMSSDYFLDGNTFYIVFLDLNHKFYKINKR